MPVVFWVAIGGGLGASARYGVNVLFARLFGHGFPWHTLVENVLGCFIMGVLTELMALKLHVSYEVRAMLTAGVLGGFTTFSAFSLDFALLMEKKATLHAFAYVAASVLISLLAVFAGLHLIRMMFPPPVLP
jgi:CrcB protein